MSGLRSALGRRLVAAGMASAMLATTVLVAGVNAAPAGGRGAPGGAAGPLGAATVASPPWQPSPSAPLARSRGVAPARVEFPRPGAWEVPLGGAGASADEGAVGSAVAARPVVVRAAGKRAAGEGAGLRVEVLDQAAARRAGASGFVFTLDGADGRSLREVAGGGALPLEVEIDYSGFAEAYGAGYAQRLQVVALPACALAAPRPAGCRGRGVRLKTRNLGNADRLVVQVPDAAAIAGRGSDTGAARRDAAGAMPSAALSALATQAAEQAARGERDLAGGRASASQAQVTPGPAELAPFGPSPRDDSGTAVPSGGTTAAGAQPMGAAATGGGLVLAVTSAVAGDTGTFAATPLSMTGQWSVSPGSGQFSYSYPIELPAPPGGSAPSVSLSYSSAAVDGLTNSRNTQASQAGLGWSDFANAFIERSYEPCINAQVLFTLDLCWKRHNATISLDGVSGPLIPLDSEFRTWRVQNDPGWKIERIGDPGAAGRIGIASSEYWKVTATDGTQYFFGLHYDPDTRRQTNGVWWVPVFGDHAGEPCWNTAVDAVGVCNMAWRWNLDRVIDPDGNLTTYHYSREANWYDLLNGMQHRTPYIRSGMLKQIEYGDRAGTLAQPAVRVRFFAQNRCVYLVAACPEVARDNQAGFPDVPVDLICDQAVCPTTTPSFFSSKRYSGVRVEVLAGTTYRLVVQHNLAHSLGLSGTSKMYLTAIQRAGISQGLPLAAYPVTKIGYIGGLLDNRVDFDPANTATKMPHRRVKNITNPFGGEIFVEYGTNRPCERTYKPTRWDTNERDCFPQTTVENGTRRTAVFHKYLVQRVVELPKHGSSSIATSYTYEGDPAWAFDFSSFDRFDHFAGWIVWRGYGTTTITRGSSTGATRTRVRVFRGLHGDMELDVVNGSLCHCGRREVQVQSLTDPSQRFDDHPSLMGRTLEEASIGEVGGVTGQIVQSTMYTYERRETALPVDEDFQRPEWAGVSTVTERVATAPDVFRERGGRTTYNERRQPATSAELGWLDVTGDERCSITTYAHNVDRWMFEYPATNRVVAGGCDSTREVSASETYYDGATTLGAPPTRGNPTRQRTKLDTAGNWATTTTQYDALGRPTAVTDPNGARTTTTYTASPAHAIPTGMTVRNALGHTSTTTFLPEFGVPSRETDANGNVTTYAYDVFGRLTRVRLPTDQPYEPGKAPSRTFGYHISPDKSSPPVVRTRQLTSEATSGEGVTWEDTWVVYDGLLRERQTQTPTLSLLSGKVLVATTIYDGQGRVSAEVVPEGVPGPPGQGLLAPESGAPWKNRTRHVYDELGREVRQQWMRGNTVHSVTTYAYGVDTVTVTGPEGNQVRETVDGLGRTITVEEHDGTGWVASRYTYDLADNLTSVTDPEGNRITYTYDLAGRRVRQDDPHRGTAVFGYDAAGNQVRAQDGKGNVVHTSYDALGRRTARRAGSATGSLLASWLYDAPGEAGLLDRSVRHTTSGDWVTDVTGYDGRDWVEGTTLTVPAGVTGLAGSYTVSQVYDRAGRVTEVTYPAVGGLPSETVTTGYDSVGLPASLIGLQAYVGRAFHDAQGLLFKMFFGPWDQATFSGFMEKTLFHDADQRLHVVKTTRATSGSVSTVRWRRLSYDKAGNITERDNVVAGLGAWRECFGYDARNRLTDAYTVARETSCATGTPGTGDQPYVHTYAYSEGNALLERSEGGTPTAYQYPASGADQPYAPVRVGDTTFEWDANGNLTERTQDGRVETFTWDVEQHLARVDGPQGPTTSVYDADGQRLLRRTSQGTTLYFAGHEVTVPADGGPVTAVRAYTFNGKLVATRTPSGVDFLVTDERGSVELAVPSGGAPSAARAYEPYGQVRASTGELPTDRGYLGQVEDRSTGLSYLNARYDDTTTGVFISPDPVYDIENPKSLNPYTYAAGNPVSMSDPSGLSPSYILGLENQNRALRDQNRQLRSHIRRLGSHITELQRIIRKQQSAIKQLLTRIETLESIIRQQASIIRKLQARVAYLTRVVNYQRVIIGRLRARIAYQARIIRYQAGVIRFQRGVIYALAARLNGLGPIKPMKPLSVGRGISHPERGLEGVHFYAPRNVNCCTIPIDIVVDAAEALVDLRDCSLHGPCSGGDFQDPPPVITGQAGIVIAHNAVIGCATSPRMGNASTDSWVSKLSIIVTLRNSCVAGVIWGTMWHE